MLKFLKVHNLVAGLRCLPDLGYGNSKLLSKHTVNSELWKKIIQSVCSAAVSCCLLTYFIRYQGSYSLKGLEQFMIQF